MPRTRLTALAVAPVVTVFVAAPVALASGPFVSKTHALEHDGAIDRIQGGDEEVGFSTVDYLTFFVEDAGVHSIDLLSWEAAPPFAGLRGFDTYSWIDVNGDNDARFFDTYMYLFRGDDDVREETFVASNDDASFEDVFDASLRGDEESDNQYGDGTEDGSIDNLDSYMEVFLEEGFYTLAVGAYDLSLEDAIFGANRDDDDDPSELIPADFLRLRGDDLFQLVPSDFGDYRATITWRDIPAPGAAALLGLTGLAGVRRRR